MSSRGSGAGLLLLLQAAGCWAAGTQSVQAGPVSEGAAEGQCLVAASRRRGGAPYAGAVASHPTLPCSCVCRVGALPADAQLAKWLRKTVVAPAAAPGSSESSSSSSGNSSSHTSGGGSISSAAALAHGSESSSSSSSEEEGSSGPSTSGRRGEPPVGAPPPAPARHGCHVLVAANKCERRGAGGEAAVSAALAEAVRLGFGEPVALSAMTGEGMSDLYEALQPLLDPIIEARRGAVQQIQAGAGGEPSAAEAGSSGGAAGEDDATAAAGSSGGGGPLRIAIMGLPNVVRGAALVVLRCSAASRP